jgi:uncharacterized lipoprotein YmbA
MKRWYMVWLAAAVTACASNQIIARAEALL